MKNGLYSTMLLLALASPVFAADKLMDQANQTFKPIPSGTPEVIGNIITPEKIELGKILFFDPRLSKSGLISCNTCHNLGMGGDDFQETSTGHGWARGPRNSPTVLNAVFNIAQFWDGRAKDLKEQAKGPVQASVEMNNTPENIIKTLKSMPAYSEMFHKVFPGQDDPVTFDNMAIAIEAFEATLTTPNSRFDKYLLGATTALNESEKNGLSLFMEKGCADCHGGMNMGGEDYFAFGVEETPDSHIIAGDMGRFKVTESKEDEYVFKSPSLRNTELTPPYFHSGRVWSLQDAISIMGSAQLGIDLNKEESGFIYDFLLATTGDQPPIAYPILPASTDSTPKPQLD